MKKLILILSLAGAAFLFAGCEKPEPAADSIADAADVEDASVDADDTTVDMDK